jgi:hypothetical protein
MKQFGVTLCDVGNIWPETVIEVAEEQPLSIKSRVLWPDGPAPKTRANPVECR